MDLNIPSNDYYVIPFGHRCTSALACKYASLRKFSLPFDWTSPTFPNKIQEVLKNDFQDFVPDVHNNIFMNKYNIVLAHFNENIEKGIEEYKRRIDRFQQIMNEQKKLYFVYINEDYLYSDDFRNDTFNDTVFKEMLELEIFLKQKYPNINYAILYFNFEKHVVPKDSKILNIVLQSTKLYDSHEVAPWNEFRFYCGELLSQLFDSQFQVLEENLNEIFNN
jgi:hypothetical protein